MAVPHTLDNSLRNHDKAVVTWLNGLTIDYGLISGVARTNHPILWVFASPERAFASTVDLLVSENWISGATATEMRANAAAWSVLPLPVVSISRGEPSAESDISSAPKSFRRHFLNPTTGRYEVHDWPLVERCDYTLSFWCAKRFTANYIMEWLKGQLGRRGATDSELFIPVTHSAPWGVVKHSLRFGGSFDQSSLEGSGQLFYRFDVQMSLRVLTFRTPTTGEHFIESVQTDLNGYSPAYGHLDTGSAYTEDTEPGVSLNMFDVIAWPIMGTATATAPVLWPDGEPLSTGLNIGVTLSTDAVDVLEPIMVSDSDGLAIVSTAFQYLSKGAASTLMIGERDITTESILAADSYSLAKTNVWRRFHRFSLIEGVIANISVVGGDFAERADVHLAHIDVRHVFSRTKRQPIVTVVGASRRYEWIGLEKRPYLIVVRATSTVGLQTFTVADDIVTPVYQESRSFSSADGVGFVLLVQPRDQSLSLVAPSSSTLALVYAQMYDAAYNGHDS